MLDEMTCRVTQEALANYKVHATSGRVVVFDTETTGISRDDEIVQLSAARYDTVLGPHAHFICEVCGSITDYPLPAEQPIPDGMPCERHHLELRVTGVCDKCAKRMCK